MNVQLKDITVTARDGRVSHLDQVYIRGSHVRYFIVPDMLRFVVSFVFCGASSRNGGGYIKDDILTQVLGMRQCSDRRIGKEEVWDLLEVVRQLVGRGDSSAVEGMGWFMIGLLI